MALKPNSRKVRKPFRLLGINLQQASQMPALLAARRRMRCGRREKAEEGEFVHARGRLRLNSSVSLSSSSKCCKSGSWVTAEKELFSGSLSSGDTLMDVWSSDRDSGEALSFFAYFPGIWAACSSGVWSKKMMESNTKRTSKSTIQQDPCQVISVAVIVTVDGVGCQVEREQCKKSRSASEGFSGRVEVVGNGEWGMNDG